LLTRLITSQLVSFAPVSFQTFIAITKPSAPAKGSFAGSQVPCKALAQVRATSTPLTLKPKYTHPLELSPGKLRFLVFDEN